MTETILDRVREVIAAQFYTDITALQPTTRVREDLGADSLDDVEIAMNLEDEFGIAIDDDAIDAGIGATVQDVANFIEGRLPVSQGAAA